MDDLIHATPGFTGQSGTLRHPLEPLDRSRDPRRHGADPGFGGFWAGFFVRDHRAEGTAAFVA
jgi:hypothetical protein